MPQYTLAQLITRANAGNIGRRGLRKLQNAGLNPAEMAASGVSSPLNVNPTADLAARRSALYAHALQAAHDLQPGQTLSAGLQRRLQLGAGSRDSLAPRSVQGAQALTQNPDNYSTILDALRKRSQGIASQAGIYKL